MQSVCVDPITFMRSTFPGCFVLLDLMTLIMYGKLVCEVPDSSYTPTSEVTMSYIFRMRFQIGEGSRLVQC